MSEIVKVKKPSKEEINNECNKSKLYMNISEINEECLCKIKRVSIIPYIVEQSGVVYFLLGIDSIYGELTDCGGMRRKTETIVETGIRELSEETMGIVDLMNKKEEVKNNSYVIYKNERIILFYKIDKNEQNKYGFPKKTHIDFYKKRIRLMKNVHKLMDNGKPVSKLNVFLENIVVYWVPHYDFINLIKERTRKIIPKGYNESPIHLPSDCQLILAINNYQNSKTYPPCDKILIGKRNKYPKVYEELRLMIHNHLNNLINIIITEYEKMK